MTRTAPIPMGLVAFMGTVVMLFTAFTASYLIRRTGTDWQALAMPGLVWVNAGLIVLSSATLEAARRRDRGFWIGATVLLALAFVAGQTMAGAQLAAQGVFLQTNPHASFFYVLTGIHGAHLLGGIGALLGAWARPAILGTAAAYWHFMGGLWIYLLILISVV